MSFYSANISRLKAPTMVKHFNYINRQEKYGKLHDLIYSESGNLPVWAKDGKDYWEETKAQEEQVEKDFEEGKVGRKINSVRKYRFALPNEMTDEEMIEFTKEYVDENFKDLPYTFAIHKKKSTIHEKENPHVHLIFSDRVNNERSKHLDKDEYYKKHGVSRYGKEYGGSYRTRDYTAKNTRVYRQTRKDLADRINAYYKEKGINKSVTEKSLKEERRNALNEGNFLKAETLNRNKPFRLSPDKFKKNEKIIQDKVKAGWRNVKDLNDVSDPEVRKRIIQEFEKEIKRESKFELNQHVMIPTEIDKIRAIENKINEMKMLNKFSPARDGISSILYKEELKKLEQERAKLSWKENNNEESYYLIKKYESTLDKRFEDKAINSLSNATDTEKIKEYAIAAYSIKEMHKKINELNKKKKSGLLFEQVNRKTDGELKKLFRKLDSRESLKDYLIRQEKSTEEIDFEIAKIKDRIETMIKNNTSPEEKDVLDKKYESIQKEIYDLKEISTNYSNRMKEAGIDNSFRDKYKKEIDDYITNLERINKYGIKDEKETASPSPVYKEVYKEVLNDTVLKRTETFTDLLNSEVKKNWDNALQEAIDKETNGALRKLQEEKEELEKTQNTTSSYDYRTVLSINNRLKKIDSVIDEIKKEKLPACEQEAKKILKEYRKDRSEKIKELVLLQKQLKKDLTRKRLNPKIAKQVEKALSGAEEKIDSLRLRRSTSRYEEKRLSQMEKILKERDSAFYKEFSRVKPRTEKSITEKLIDISSGKELSKLKEQIRSQESLKEYALKQGRDTAVYDNQIHILNKKIEDLKQTHRTPELLLKAKELSKLTRNRWTENRKIIQKMEQQIRKDSKRKYISGSQRKAKEKILSYAKYQLSKQKLLDDTVSLRVIALKDKVLKTIPRKEEFYLKQIINERTGNNLKKLEDRIYQTERMRKVNDFSQGTAKDLERELKELKAAKTKLIAEYKTPEIKKEVMNLKEFSLTNLNQNMKQLQKEYDALIRDSQRKYLSGKTKETIKKDMNRIGKIVYRSDRIVKTRNRRDQTLQTMKKLQYKATTQTLRSLRGIPSLKDPGGSATGRANIRVYRDDDFER